MYKVGGSSLCQGIHYILGSQWTVTLFSNMNRPAITFDACGKWQIKYCSLADCRWSANSDEHALYTVAPMCGCHRLFTNHRQSKVMIDEDRQVVYTNAIVKRSHNTHEDLCRKPCFWIDFFHYIFMQGWVQFCVFQQINLQEASETTWDSTIHTSLNLKTKQWNENKIWPFEY